MPLKLSKPSTGGLKKPAGKTTLSKPGKPQGFGSTAKAKPKPGGTFARADAAIKEAERRRAMPWRASIPVGSSGVEVYFLDRGEPFSMYEHSLGGSKTKAGKIYPCIKDTNEPCPACAKDPKGDGYFIMLLTAVIPRIKVTNRDGETKTYHFQKKEWPVKIKMVKKYQRLFQSHGTFRGMVVRVSRDAKLDPATGNDVEFVRMMTEAEIKKYASNPKYKDAKLAEPFNFEEIHKRPSAKELKKMIGAVGDDSAGSADFDEDDESEFGEAEGGGWGDDED